METPIKIAKNALKFRKKEINDTNIFFTSRHKIVLTTYLKKFQNYPLKRHTRPVPMHLCCKCTTAQSRKGWKPHSVVKVIKREVARETKNENSVFFSTILQMDPMRVISNPVPTDNGMDNPQQQQHQQPLPPQQQQPQPIPQIPPPQPQPPRPSNNPPPVYTEPATVVPMDRGVIQGGTPTARFHAAALQVTVNTSYAPCNMIMKMTYKHCNYNNQQSTVEKG